MKNPLFVMIFVAAILLNGCKSTQMLQATEHSVDKHKIARLIEDIIAGVDQNVNIGIKISALKSGAVTFEKNADRHFVPASTMKVITVAAALHYLGPSFRFRTTLYTDSHIDKTGTIKNLYIKGSGDPSLMDHDLMNLVSELKQMGVKQITGDIYVDDGVFDDVLWSKGAMWDDRHRGFAAPVCGLNVNYNRLLIKTVPSRNINGSAHSVATPKSSFVDVLSDATTGKKSALTLSVERGQHRENDWPSQANDGLHFGDKVIIGGQTSKAADPHYHLLAINDPGMLVATLVKDQLQLQKIKVKGKIVRMATPDDALMLAVHESRSLAEALIDFTKISNNVANDALIKAMAFTSGVRPATASAGFKRVGDFLAKEVGIDPNTIVTADGSGVSRYNLITPAQMVKLLLYTANRFAYGPEFMASLPMSGQDGTVGRWLRADHLRKRVRAKDGNMASLSSLVGVLTGMDGEHYAFAIMINNFVGSASKYLDMQAQILSAMMTDDKVRIKNNAMTTRN